MKAVVTGASRGIGRGIATVLASEGCAVGLLARAASADRLAAVRGEIESAGGTAFVQTCDLRDASETAAALDALVDSLGGVDVLVNNAGLVIRKDAMSLSLDEWHAMVETNVNGVFHATRAVLPRLVAQRSGHIVNVSSISGYHPLPGGSGYAATKYAVTGFSESLFHEVREHGIKVTTVFPGSVDSDSHRHAGQDGTWKVRPDEVGRAVWDVVRTRPENCISRVEIRPLNRPPR